MARRSNNKWSQEEITQFLRTNDQVLYASLKELYQCQLEDEQSQEVSIYNNRRGFAKPDAKMLTTLAKLLIEDGTLNFENTQTLRNKLVKRYTKQITKLANASWRASQAQA